MSLLITQAKPNPAGKDRIGRSLTPQIQLVGEWVDFQNIDSKSLMLDGTILYHWAYLQNGSGEWRDVINLYGNLGSGEIVRVHSGGQIPLTQMREIDRVGAHHHLFTGKDYIWNNQKEDFPSLWYQSTRQWIDQTKYDAYPIEGKILRRTGEKLF